ncbi:acyl-CoA dehydrogenase family protein [Noviherbaspirillum saxi]|uniref:Acyl-CoA dehydrogenase n=1 Tax=Noviherbaspirillum saxi TaxID=2320863 RepID=A0A3A3FJR5_9BURK|nr:acyl-CoA dehydrogenase family protein [Noviherbaspirillum saxi]RJF91722.1 acyl-CoA dehydrogenase [Noviherbaspirillum saxi]
MDFNLSDEQRMLVDGAQRYIRERYSLDAKRAAAKTEEGFSREHWEKFAELGWLAMGIPEDCGGMGGSPVDIALLMEQLGAGLVAEPVLDTAILAGTLLAQASGSQRAIDLLGDIAAGEKIVVLAHMERAGRSEYDTPVSARAKRSGEGWQLSGIKHRVWHGASADCLLITVRLGETNEIGVLAVDRNAPGVDLTVYEMLDGTHAADIRFDAVELDSSALILRGPAVDDALAVAFDHTVLAMTSSAIGSMDAVMAMTGEYLKTRVQYGQPLAKFQALQHRMSEMFVETDQARSIVYRALAALESGDAQERATAVSSAKSLVARACRFVTGHGIQLHGAIGTTEEYAVGHHYRAMLMYDYRFGDATYHLERSAGLLPRIA